jgi:type IV pilus assembly protein PilQ
MRLLGALVIVLAAAPAHADRDLCARGAIYRGATIDLDVKSADVHDVFRLLSDVGRINLAMGADVAGKVTLKLKRVPWDQVACTVAAVHRLAITLQGNVMLVQRR